MRSFFVCSHFDGNPESLELGQEVQYTLAAGKITAGKISAENVRTLSKGNSSPTPVESEVFEGIIVRPLRNVNPDQAQYAGLVKVGSDGQLSACSALKWMMSLNFFFAADADEPVYEFGITSLENKKEFLQRGDQVQFQLEKTPDGSHRAAMIRVVRKKLRSSVDAIKGQFGFLNYEVEDGKKLFFHLSEVKDNATLQPGDAVEFVLITNQRTGKSSACNVAKV